MKSLGRHVLPRRIEMRQAQGPALTVGFGIIPHLLVSYHQPYLLAS